MLPEFLSFISAAAKLVQLCLFAMSNHHKASDADLDQKGAEKKHQANHSDGFLMFYCNTDWLQVNYCLIQCSSNTRGLVYHTC